MFSLYTSLAGLSLPPRITKQCCPVNRGSATVRLRTQVKLWLTCNEKRESGLRQRGDNIHGDVTWSVCPSSSPWRRRVDRRRNFCAKMLQEHLTMHQCNQRLDTKYAIRRIRATRALSPPTARFWGGHKTAREKSSSVALLGGCEEARARRGGQADQRKKFRFAEVERRRSHAIVKIN